MLDYVYDRGDGRRKHCWKHDYAGFVPGRRGSVGKCPRSIDDAVAEQLLREGIAEPDPFGEADEPPERIYNVHRGVVYVAVPGEVGRS